MAQQPIWPGSGSAVSGSTPFGLYDNDSEFQTEAPKFATWCARRLGYPIMSVELQDVQFYACLEESITEYSAQVNQFNIVDNLLTLKGQPTGSNFTHKNDTPTLGRQVRLAEQYGTEAGVGGSVDSISITDDGAGFIVNETITIADAQLGGGGAASLTFDATAIHGNGCTIPVSAIHGNGCTIPVSAIHGNGATIDIATIFTNATVNVATVFTNATFSLSDITTMEIGATLTGTTSNSSGVITAMDSTSVTVDNVSGFFKKGETVGANDVTNLTINAFG